MKIGILTLHYAHNYGAMLQTYASVRLLSSLGHSVRVIDYRNPAVEASYRPWRFDGGRLRSEGFTYLLKYVPESLSRSIRSRGFRRFIRRFPLTRSFEGFDAVLVGSDQVWNPRWTGGPDPVYHGAFECGEAKKIAWSASSDGVDPVFHGRFDALSVREKTLFDSLTARGEESALLQDPVLLVDPTIWNDLAGVPSAKGYVLAYPMLEGEKVISLARKVAENKGLPLIILSPRASWRCRKGTEQWASPERFLSLVAGASCVVTSSFHGVAFSIVFQKPFLSVPVGENVRTGSLLESVGLSSRLVNDGRAEVMDEPIDYERVSEILHSFRSEAEAFLDNALKR